MPSPDTPEQEDVTPGLDQPGLDPPSLDPLGQAILDLLQAPDAKASVTPEAVAKAYADTKAKPGASPELWRRYLMAVRQQAIYLARQNRLTILRKGKPTDPHGPVKGVIRLALPSSGDASND